MGGAVGTDLVADGVELGLGLLPLQPERHRVHLEEGLTAFDLLVVMDEHLRHHPVHRRGDKDVLRLDVGVLGRDDPAGGRIPDAARGHHHERSEGEEEDAAESSDPVAQAAHPAAAEPSFALRSLRGFRRGHQPAPAAIRRGSAASSNEASLSRSPSGRSARFARMVSKFDWRRSRSSPLSPASASWVVISTRPAIFSSTGVAFPRQVQPPRTAIGGVRAAFNPARVLETIEMTGEGRRLEFQYVGEPSLVDPFVPREMSQHDPLRLGETDVAGASIEPLAQHPGDVVHEKSEDGVGTVPQHAKIILAS